MPEKRVVFRSGWIFVGLAGILFASASLRLYALGEFRGLLAVKQPAALAALAARALNVDSCTVLSFDPLGAVAQRRLRMPIDGEIHTLVLTPASVRSSGFRVIVDSGDGFPQEANVGPPTTLRGELAEIPGSVAAASVIDGQMYLRIILPDDTNYWLEPLSEHLPDAGPGVHAIYRRDDAVPAVGSCLLLEHDATNDFHNDVGAREDSSGSVAGTGLMLAELLIDTDVELFNVFGSEDGIVSHIENVINAVNIQYERDVSIRHAITQIVVRPNSAPFSATDPIELLRQFTNFWQLRSEPRDVAQLFTGKNLDGDTIGIAWLGGLCSTVSGYSVVQTTCCTVFQCKTDLSAHELAHSWNARHCGDDGPNDPFPCSPSCPGFTMNCSLTCANQFNSTQTIPDIIAFRDTRTCLDPTDELRRLIITAPSDTVLEGGFLAFTATADFRFGEDQDVTMETTWWVDRPEVGSIASNGRFTAADVEGDTCVTVFGSFTSDGMTAENSRTIMVLDGDVARAIVGGVPPPETIDARQPMEPEGGEPQGWRVLELTFNGDTCLATSADFVISQLGVNGTDLAIADFQKPGPRSVRIELNRVIEPGAWTVVTEVGSGAAARVGFLPGDVTGDGAVDETDVATLFAALNGDEGAATLPPSSLDADRSGLLAAGDLLRLIDLHIGALPYAVWAGATLPP